MVLKIQIKCEVWKDKSEHFMDVTLAWSDNQQIGAHKIIFSASSTKHMNLITRNKERLKTRTFLKNYSDNAPSTCFFLSCFYSRREDEGEEDATMHGSTHYREKGGGGGNL